jgi:glycosyltransferase involved in cell wall biosynthesis
MKKVLWISYLFPPLNCGVGRQVKIAKYLPTYGWLPVVLSVKRSKLRPFYDASVVKDIPPNVEVHRTWSLESKLLMSYLPAALHINPKWLHIPDQFIGWFPFALRKGLHIIRNQKVDVIFSTSLPNTCHLVGYALKLRTGLPWVADFRDLWTQSTYVSFPRLVLGVENKMEAAVMRAADRITTINDPIRQDIQRKYSKQPAEKFITIPHGFDPEDFVDSNSTKKASCNRFTLTYTGSLYGRRKIDTFAYAIKELIDEDSSINEKLNIRFVGNVLPARTLCKQLGLDRVMIFSDMVTHQEARDYLSASDVLLFVLGTGDLDEKASTGKLFEYLAIGKPVLALGPEGVASNIIREANIGIVVNPENKEAIKQAFSKMYTRWLSGDLQISPNKEFIDQYDIRRLSGKFATIFDELIDRQS